VNKVAWYALVVFVAGVFYGLLVPIVKLASAQGISPSDILPSMYIVVFVLSGIAMLVRRERPRSRREVGELVLLGFLVSGTSIFYYNSVALLPSSVAGTLLFQYVWIGIVIDCVVRRTPPERITVLVVIIVLVGTCFAAGIFDGEISGLNTLGIVFGLCSAVVYALYLYSSGKLGTGSPGCLRMTMVGLGGLIATLATRPSYITGGMIFNTSAWPFALILAFTGVIFPVALIAYASPHLQTGIVNIMAASELPAGVLTAWAIVGDVPSPLALVGVVLVLAGIVINQIPLLVRSRKREPASSDVQDVRRE
jgi:drug/metabolite transporter (DMT)-like permease